MIRNYETTVTAVSDRELVIQRFYEGPADIVFRVWTEPQLVARWWAPQSMGARVISCEAEVRDGGCYRYVQQPPQGASFAFFGEYLEVTPPKRLVYTQIFEPMAGAGAVQVTATFSERDGGTELELREIYPSPQALQMALSSGMEAGLRIVLEQVAALVAEISGETR